MSRPGETGFVDPLRPGLSSGAVDYSDLDGFYRGGQAATGQLLERYILAHVGEFLEIAPE